LANSSGTDFIKFLNAGGNGLGDGCQGFLVGDFNGDGLSDLMELMDNWWDENPPFHYHMQVSLAKTGIAGFEGFYPTQPIEGFQLPWLYRFRGEQIGDFNGDGLDDIAVRCSHRANYGEYDDTYDCKIVLSQFDVANNTLQLNEITPNITNINKFIVGRFYDKTRNDLLVLKEGHTLIYYWNKSINNFTILTPEIGNYPSKYHTIFPADFNGDGITDILTCSSAPDFNWDLIEFTGKEEWPWPPVSITFLPHTDPNAYQGRYNVFPSDYNGDGKSDIMSIDSYTDQVKFFFSKGKGQFIDPPETTTLDVFCVSSKQFTFNDFNGDGIADILYKRFSDEQRVMLLVHPNDKTELVQTVTNGLGKKDKITYTPLSTSDAGIYQKYHTTYATTQAAVKDFQGPLYVVNYLQTENGQGTFLSKKFSYEGAHIQRLTKDFLGFSKISTTDYSTGIQTVSTYNFLVSNDGAVFPESFYFPHVEKTETYFNENLIGQVDNVFQAYQYYPEFSWDFQKRMLFFPYLV